MHAARYNTDYSCCVLLCLMYYCYYRNTLQITAMLSSAGEVVQLDTPVKITDRVEEWLVCYFNLLNFQLQYDALAVPCRTIRILHLCAQHEKVVLLQSC
jgi:hypothetical protein